MFNTKSLAQNAQLVAVLLTLIAFSFNATAQTSQYVTTSGLIVPNGQGVLFQTNTIPCTTNQVISLVGYDSSSQPYVYGYTATGTILDFINNNSPTPINLPVLTGLTNIAVVGHNASSVARSFWATFQITTPASANVVSNYVPADAIVIPASATGNVQIILESSTDLLNWTAANPGTYSASSATNRFFRVRAVHN